MSWLKQAGALHIARERGAFVDPESPEPVIEEDEEPRPATAKMFEFLPGSLLAALYEWREHLPRLREAA